MTLDIVSLPWWDSDKTVTFCEIKALCMTVVAISWKMNEELEDDGPIFPDEINRSNTYVFYSTLIVFIVCFAIFVYAVVNIFFPFHKLGYAIAALVVVGGMFVALIIAANQLRITWGDFNMQAWMTAHLSNKVYWDRVQTKYRCCGVNGPSDWENDKKTNTIPDSCIDYESGCYSALHEAISPLIVLSLTAMYVASGILIVAAFCRIIELVRVFSR